MPLHGDGSINTNFNCWTVPDESGLRDTLLEFKIVSGVIVQDDKLYLDSSEEGGPANLQFQLKISKYHMGWKDRGGTGYLQKISGHYYREETLSSATFPVDETIQTSSVNPTPYSTTRTFNAAAIIAMANGITEEERPDSFILWPSNSIKMWNDEEIQSPISPNSYKAPMFYETIEYDRIFLPIPTEGDDEPEAEPQKSTISMIPAYGFRDYNTESQPKESYQTIGRS